MKRDINSAEEMIDVAREFVDTSLSKILKDIYIVGLRGDLGAGKTTFSQGVARVLGVKEAVISPTFVLAKTYTTTHSKWKRLIHIDAYRFEKPEEANVLKLESQVTQGTLILLEWPSLVDGVIVPDVYIDITQNKENGRTISYETFK